MKMLRLFLILTLITGTLYPIVITIIGTTFFSSKANGSLVEIGGKIIGSELLAQEFKENRFFHPRPSASNYATIGSGGTQASLISNQWKKKVEERRMVNPDGGADAWTSSGSGLDPHISPKNAYAQLRRVALARKIDPKELKKLIERHIEEPILGIWGQPRVNVLRLNLSLEAEGHYDDTR